MQRSRASRSRGRWMLTARTRLTYFRHCAAFVFSAAFPNCSYMRVVYIYIAWRARAVVFVCYTNRGHFKRSFARTEQQKSSRSFSDRRSLSLPIVFSRTHRHPPLHPFILTRSCGVPSRERRRAWIRIPSSRGKFFSRLSGTPKFRRFFTPACPDLLPMYIG